MKGAEVSGPPSTTLHHNYVPGMLDLHYNSATAAIFVNIPIIVPLASKNVMHHIPCLFAHNL